MIEETHLLQKFQVELLNVGVRLGQVGTAGRDEVLVLPQPAP